MLVRALVTLALFASLGAPARAQGEDPSAGPTFPDPELTHTAALQGGRVVSEARGYSFELPSKAWTLHDAASSPMQVTDADAELTSKDGGVLAVWAEDPTLNARALSKLGQDWVKKTYESFVAEKTEERKLGAHDVVIVTGTATPEEGELKYHMIFVATEKNCYSFCGWAPAPLIADNTPQFEKIVQSLVEIGPLGEPAPGANPSASPDASPSLGPHASPASPSPAPVPHASASPAASPAPSSSASPRPAPLPK